jgi:ankyrin repeat protein
MDKPAINGIEMIINPSSKGNKLFCDAIFESNLDEVNRLIEQVNVNTLKCDGATPLFLASGIGHVPVVEALLKKGADPNKARTDDGRTPLYIASGFGHYPVVEALLKKGADPNKAKTDDGRTPLYVASHQGYLSVVEALLKKGADPNKARTDGTTPIQVATTPEIANFMRDYERRNSIMATSAALYPITRDTDAALPLDLYEYMGKKDPNGNYVAGRRRKTRKPMKSNKSSKSKKSNKSKKSRKSKKSMKSKKRRRL